MTRQTSPYQPGDVIAGRTDTRFEIGHPVEGLIDFAPTRCEAMRIAKSWAQSHTGYPDATQAVRVFDAMAHLGAPDTWGIFSGHWRVTRYHQSQPGDDIAAAIDAEGGDV